MSGCFTSLFASLHPGLPNGSSNWNAADLGEIVLQTMGKWMAGENLAPLLAVLSHRSVGYRRTIVASVHYKCPVIWSLEVAVFHALTKDSFPVWVAGRKLFLGWNIHRCALLRRPGCVIRVELTLLAWFLIYSSKISVIHRNPAEKQELLLWEVVGVSQTNLSSNPNIGIAGTCKLGVQVGKTGISIHI